ncbi:MAG: prepilin-type N-terminal cleavage/methylation domain-containing protein [Candidatus Gracilibacteria bacterium]|nr:prepilin-type N-terminal cleavage/methylation domain-containing protein [Candidatus Gracilibacteria bacterium]
MKQTNDPTICTDVAMQYIYHKQRKNFLGFTLIELIVVITILVILGTIAFLNLGGFQSSARDSSRIENLANLKKGLDIFRIQSGTYPMPEGPVTITASGTSVVSYQGFAKDGVGGMAKLSPGATQDPLDTSIYTTYSINADRTKMELMNFLEDTSTLTLNAFVPNASADIGSDYSKRYPTVQGDTLGILLASGTLQPIQETGTGVDVVNTNSGYVAVFGKGDSMSGSGRALFIALAARQKELNVLDPNLVGYWDMETLTPDGKLKDLSATHNDGVCYTSGTVVKSCGTSGQGPQFVNGDKRTGRAMSFDGVNTYIKNLLSPYDFADQSFTVDFIVKSDINNYGFVFAEGAVGAGWGIQTSTGTSLYVNSFIKHASNQQSIYASTGSNNGGDINTWNHFSMIVTTSTVDPLYIRTSQSIYLNGVLISGWPANEGVVYTPSNMLFTIGARMEGATGHFKGLIDEVRIYNRALSDTEIRALYTSSK